MVSRAGLELIRTLSLWHCAVGIFDDGQYYKEKYIGSNHCWVLTPVPLAKSKTKVVPSPLTMLNRDGGSHGQTRIKHLIVRLDSWS